MRQSPVVTFALYEADEQNLLTHVERFDLPTIGGER
jgi:hypothetical protein